MTADPDIQFGDIEEDQPGIELRPDRNAHYAVVPYKEPVDGELPIFVDLDTLIEMESHALTDMTVELGGVMLGGHLTDKDGQSYVLVQDSVRAQHYEATKGSFKFTHDTWGQITKERSDFPDDWSMVGWYHTHPDWGVFLSEMDMFICDNFFNKPLDVALVIDPCQQDRGFFQWTGDPQERKRRVGGFYVIASRHRQAELEHFVAELEEGYTMRTDPNTRAGYNVSSGRSGAPTIVNISEQRPGWLGQAVVMSLVFQTIILLFFGYRMLSPAAKPADNSDDVNLEIALARRDIKFKTQVLDDVIKSISGDRDVASKLQKQQAELEKLNQQLELASVGVPVLVSERDKLKTATERLDKKAKGWEADYRKLRTVSNAQELEIKALKAKLNPTGGGGSPWYAWFITGPGVVASLVVIVFMAVSGVIAFRGYNVQDTFPEDLYNDPPPEGRISLSENGAPQDQASEQNGD